MKDLQLNEIKEELAVFLRNEDIFTVGERGVTTTTDEFNGDTIETNFTLDNTNVKNVRAVTVGGVAVAFGSGYTVNYSTAVVTFASPPATGTDNVDIQYDYGNTDKIFPDYPRPDLTLSSFPRIGFDIINIDTSEGALGGGIFRHRITIRLNIYELESEEIDKDITTIKESIKDNKKGFFYVEFMTINLIGPTLNTEFGSNKILMRSMDLLMPYDHESV